MVAPDWARSKSAFAKENSYRSISTSRLFSKASAIESDSDKYKLPARSSESIRLLLDTFTGGTTRDRYGCSTPEYQCGCSAPRGPRVSTPGFCWPKVEGVAARTAHSTATYVVHVFMARFFIR